MKFSNYEKQPISSFLVGIKWMMLSVLKHRAYFVLEYLLSKHFLMYYKLYAVNFSNKNPKVWV